MVQQRIEGTWGRGGERVRETGRGKKKRKRKSTKTLFVDCAG